MVVVLWDRANISAPDFLGLPSGQRGALTLGLVVAAVFFELVLTTDFVVEV